MTILGSLVAVVLAPVAFAQIEAPEQFPFADYPASVASHGVPVAPRLTTPGQGMYRTVIRRWAWNGPNFAGHFTIAEWGCGTGCVQMAVVDAQSGHVYEGPFGTLPNASIYLGANVDEDKTGLFYRLDSSLFVVRGSEFQEMRH
jgi:hypothetical protein